MQYQKFKPKNQVKINFLPQISYQFPIILPKFQHIKGKKEFKQLMRYEAQGKQLDHHWKIDKKNIGNCFRIYVKCLKCKANIKYNQNADQSWTLINFNTLHIHQVQDGNQTQQNKNLNIFNQFTNKNQLQKCENITTKKLIDKNSNFQYIKRLLKHLRYDFKYQHHSQNIQKLGYPQTLVAVSQEQKSNYRNYGQSISYDITYNCIKQLSYINKKYGVGIFSGFDNNNRVLIFGFSITTTQTVQNFKNIFASFFDLMGFTNTTAIVTDQQRALIFALRQLKVQCNYKYHHIYDNWHFLKSFRQNLKTKNSELITQLTNKLAKTMRETDPKVGLSYQISLKESMENIFPELYSKIQKKLNNVCIWRMPKKFIGLSLHSNQCINDLLKLKVQYQTSIYELISKLDKVSKQRIKKCKSTKKLEFYPFEKFFRDTRIEEVRKKFEKKVFDVFIYNYRRSQFYFIKIHHQKNKYQIEHKFDHDKYIIEEQFCECGATQKTGIPCEHLIYINRQKNGNQNYVRLFNQRWLIFQERKQRLSNVGIKQSIKFNDIEQQSQQQQPILSIESDDV